MPSEESLTLRLLRTRHAPSLAREAVREFGAGWPAETLHNALLVVSELVTNVVLHGDGVIIVAVECRGESVAIAVRDEGDGGLMMLEQTADSESGYGLAIVDGITDVWGVRRVDQQPGKSVWCRLSPRTGTQ